MDGGSGFKLLIFKLKIHPVLQVLFWIGGYTLRQSEGIEVTVIGEKYGEQKLWLFENSCQKINKNESIVLWKKHIFPTNDHG